jgi:hypothetical protein
LRHLINIKEEADEHLDMMSLPPKEENPVKIKEEPENDLDTKSLPPVIHSSPRHPDAPPYNLLASVS